MEQTGLSGNNTPLTDYLARIGTDMITSRTNPRVVRYAKLQDKKYRDEYGLFLAQGHKLTIEALRYGDVETVIVAQSLARQEREKQREIACEVARLAQEKQVPVMVFADAAFEKISTEKAPQGVIAVVRKPDTLHTSRNFTAWQQERRLLMLDEIRDPGNLGTILRSAEAMGMNGVILSSCADLYSEKTVRAAMGSLFRIPVYLTDSGIDCVRMMKDAGRRVLAAGLGEHTLLLGQYETDKTDCVIIGNEGHGVSEGVMKEATASLKIPMAGETESLNASAAAICILWEYFRK